MSEHKKAPRRVEKLSDEKLIERLTDAVIAKLRVLGVIPKTPAEQLKEWERCEKSEGR